MFHQQINNEEVEEEPEEEPEEEDDEDFWESVNNDDDEEEIPDATYVTQKLIERGITMEDLVKNILFQEHSDWGEKYSDYERRSSEIFGQFRAIISRYTPPNALNNNPVNNNPIMPDIVPHVHEEKENKMLKRREFMTHV